MPNIILTEYCNLKCPYCFANQMIESSEKNNITMTQLDNILNWLLLDLQNEPCHIGLLGGEPTLHPQFKEILNKINYFSSLTNATSTIFTNGLNLSSYITSVGINTSILININKLPINLTKKLISNLDLVNYQKWFEINKVILGCNLYAEETDYSFFWNIIDQYPINEIRMSVTSPTQSSLKNDKKLYYNAMKDIFIDFLKQAKKRQIKINYDCNQLPLCFLTQQEQELVNSLGQYHNACEPVIDITPDFKATCCFGVYNNPIECNEFNNLSEMEKYFKSQMLLKTINNNTSICQNCKELTLMQCQGGCLSFSSLGKKN